MDRSVWNTKVAKARWENARTREQAAMRHDGKTAVLKAELCGLLAGDGSIQVRKEKTFWHHQIDFFPDDEEMLARYLSLMLLLYRKTPRIFRKEKLFIARISSKTIAEDLLATTHFGLHAWRVPAFVLEDKECAAAWLRGFFSAEAHVNDQAIRVQTVNAEGMRQIARMLEGLHIKSRQYTYQPKRPLHNPVSILIIGRNADRMRFFDTIGFAHAKKQLALRKALDL